MQINYFKLEDVAPKQLQNIMQRSETDIKAVKGIVEPIIKDVQQNGDAALIKYALQLDKADIAAKGIKATEEDFARAEQELEPEIKQAIKHCAENVKTFHQEQFNRIEKLWLSKVEGGVYAGEKVTSIDKVGVYVPRGKGCFPSVMYMLCAPAMVAGVPEIAVCTPPNPQGDIDAASLYAAQICGIKNVYKAGGAQAVAAFAYGTETIPKVYKMVGPGNSYVAAARRLLSDKLDPGMPAGPSEALILADSTANVYNTALDLLNEAEHGPDSASVLVTDSQQLADEVAKLLPTLIADLPEQRQNFCKTVFSNYGAIILTKDMPTAIEFANQYAVEHLLLKVKNPEQVLPQLRNTGEVLIGDYSPIAMGNYGIGVNAILPTGQHSKTYSATSVWDFLIRTTIAFADEKGFAALGEDVEKLTVYEGFTAHGDVIRKREALSPQRRSQELATLQAVKKLDPTLKD